MSGNIYCLVDIQGQTQLPREHVCCSSGKDAESRLCPDHSLNCFVDCSVAACDNHVRTAIVSGLCSQHRSVTWSGCKLQFDFDSLGVQIRGKFLDGFAPGHISSGLGV